MTELVDAEDLEAAQTYLQQAPSKFLRTIAAYLRQVERERDGLLVRCEHLCKQLNEKERENSQPKC